MPLQCCGSLAGWWSESLSVAIAVLALIVQQHFLQGYRRWRAYTDLWSHQISVGLRFQCSFLSSHAFSTNTHIYTLTHITLHTPPQPSHPFLPRNGRPYTALFSCPPITKAVRYRRSLGIPRAFYLRPPPSPDFVTSVPFSDPTRIIQVRNPTFSKLSQAMHSPEH